MNKLKASEARKVLLQTQGKIDSIVNALLAARLPLTPGKVTHLLTKCGKKRCKCLRGEPHQSSFLYVSRGGPLQRIYLSQKDRDAVTAGSERYRRFRTRRAELVKLFKELLDAVDQLENSITTPFVKKERKGK